MLGLYFMKNSIIITLALLIFPLTIFASEEIEVDIETGGQHEECFYIENEKTLNYVYQSNAPLNFNFHFHDDKGMNFLVELPSSIENKDTINSLQSKQVYCLMWVNSSEKPASLRYEFTME